MVGACHSQLRTTLRCSVSPFFAVSSAPSVPFPPSPPLALHALDGRPERRQDGPLSVQRFAIACSLAAAGSFGLQAQPRDGIPPTLESVLARAAAYVEEFRQQLSGIAAEETYVQEEIPGSRRETRSELLLVRSGVFPRWLQFRDTFEVDGAPVRDRADRLTALFAQDAGSAREQALRIAAESTRYNLGDVVRTINVPLMPLVILEPDVQKRFRFSRGADREAPAGMPDDAAAGHFRVSTEVWVVRFEERERPTIVRDAINHRDVPTKGRFWLDPASGRVLMSEMRSEHPGVLAEITVSYQSEPLVGLFVPIAMRETYTNMRRGFRGTRGPWRRIEATATYGRFRQFQVQTDERIGVPDAERRTPNDR